MHQKIFRFLFWTANITLVNESYMVVIVCLFINVQNLSFESDGLAAMSIICIVFFVLYTIVPAFFICRTCVNHEKIFGNKFKLLEPKWKAMYGAFYEALDLKAGRKIFLHTGFFLLRRLLIGIAVTLVGDVFFWQLLIFVG